MVCRGLVCLAAVRGPAHCRGRWIRFPVRPFGALPWRMKTGSFPPLVCSGLSRAGVSPLPALRPAGGKVHPHGACRPS
jgi:hypothetical protein